MVGYQHEPRCQDIVGMEGAADAKVLVEDLGGNKPYSFSVVLSRLVQYDSI